MLGFVGIACAFSKTVNPYQNHTEPTKWWKKSVQTRNPNPTKIKQKAIFCKRPFFGFRASPFFGFLRECVGRVARFVHESWKRLVNASPLATLLIGPSTWLLSRKPKNSNQNVLSFQLGLCSAIIPPELGAAGILEAPIFPSKIGSGGAHKANRFLARLFFSGLFERLLFFVLGDSQANLNRMAKP